MILIEDFQRDDIIVADPFQQADRLLPVDLAGADRHMDIFLTAVVGEVHVPHP